MSDCSSKERDEELTLFLRHIVKQGGHFTTAAVIATHDCPEHGGHATSFICRQEIPNTREHVRKLVERMRLYADSLERHFLSADQEEPTKAQGPQN